MNKILTISFIKKIKNFVFILIFLLINYLSNNVFSSFEIINKQNDILTEQRKSYKKTLFSKNLSEAEKKDEEMIQRYCDMELKFLQKRNIEFDILILIVAILLSIYVIDYIAKRIELNKLEKNNSELLPASITELTEKGT